MQDEYDCVYCIVDFHALTTVETTENLRQNTYEMALDLLAAGIRPDETIMFVQSHVPEVAELHLLLSMVTPLGKLTDLPTFKEKVRQQPHNVNYGLVGYPVLMTADIVLYKADTVPVGIDQEPHIEFAREVVRSFNYRYNTSVLVEPQMKHHRVPQGDRHRRSAEDEQEPQQPHRAGIHRRRDAGARDANGHRSGAHPAQRSGQSGRLQRLHLP